MIIKRIAGIDVNDNSAKVVEIYGSERSHRITALGTVDIADNVITDGVIVNKAAAAVSIKELWTVNSVKTKNLIFGVDNKYVLVRYADIKSDGGKSLKDDIEAQIQQFLPVDRNSVEVDYLPLSEVEGDEGNKKINTLLVAAGKKMLGDYIWIFKENKFNIEDIDVNTLSIYRLLPEGADNDKGVMMINFKKGLFNILIVKNGRPLFARNISIDTSGALNESEFIKEYFEAINKDIITSLAYYNSTTGNYIENIYITGYGVWNESMVQFLREKTRAEVKVINPFINAKNKSGTPNVPRPYEYALAYSLALRGLESE